MTAEQGALALSMAGTTAAEGTATAATAGLSAAFKGLWATLVANPFVAIAAATTAIFVAGVKITKHLQDQVKTFAQVKTELEDATASVKSYQDKLATTRERIQELKDLILQLYKFHYLIMIKIKF